MGAPVVHFEIGCKNVETSSNFYTTLFGWKTAQMGPALTIDTGSGQGIPGHFTALGHEPFRYTTFYVQVDDINASLAKVGQLGGKTVVPKVDVPGYGSFAWFSDLDGNVVGLWTPLKA